MAEIMVERRPKKSPWRWLVLLAVVVLLGASGWYFLAGPGQGALDRDDGVELEERPIGGG